MRLAVRGLWGQTRWRNNGGLQTFLQTFPNLTCFSPSFSKESFGGFVKFQRVTRVPNPKSPFPNFSSLPPPFGLVPNALAPHSASRSNPSVFSGSSCCGTAGRTFRPSLNFVSQNSLIARIRFPGKPKGESVVGQFEFSTSNATGLARQECAHLRRSGRRNSKKTFR